MTNTENVRPPTHALKDISMTALQTIFILRHNETRILPPMPLFWRAHLDCQVQLAVREVDTVSS